MAEVMLGEKHLPVPVKMVPAEFFQFAAKQILLKQLFTQP